MSYVKTLKSIKTEKPLNLMIQRLF
ncbi:hypothetical protein KL86CLO1_11036 [uncultured Eubacteriales bacterium]|uniref:Uncharacterized protein n=1 Tax=uncultured Eubacteriales bacterium TaxID=172733 RepID=A0A212JG30_9FIRM|nr:hypothetical protein KL86CLO1_11036 [uncultured Eubacteriales bacterium]